MKGYERERERKREIGERECNYSGKYGKFTKHLPTLNTTMENLLAPPPSPPSSIDVFEVLKLNTR